MDGMVFLFALALYGWTLQRGPFPGVSATWLIAARGLDPFPPLTNPLYSGLSRFVAAIPWGLPSIRLGLLNAILGAATAALLGRCVRRLPPLAPGRTEDHFLPWISGLLSSVMLVVSFPFWLSATRPSHELLAIGLLVACGAWLIRAVQKEGTADLYGFCALYGVAVAEQPVALMLSPFFAIAAVIIAIRKLFPPPEGVLLPARVEGKRLAHMLVQMGMCAFAGLLLPLLLMAAWHAYGSLRIWREASGFAAAFREVALAYRLSLLNLLPSVGWLLWIALAAIPFLYAASASLLAPPLWFITPSQALWHLALFASALGILLLDAIAPTLASQLFDSRISAVLLSAFTLGRLVVWTRPIPETRSRLQGRGLWRPVWLALTRAGAVIMLGAVAFTGVRLIRSAARQRLTDFALDVARHLDGRGWLLAETPEDEIVLAAMADRGISVRMLRPWLADRTAYRRYVASQFSDLRLRDLTQLDLRALLNEWIGREPWGGADLVSIGQENLWRAAGRRPLPIGPLTRGARLDEPIAQLEGLAKRNLEWARRYVGLAESALREPWPWTRHWNLQTATRVSRSANNTGAWLEEEGRADLAEEAYRIALGVFPDNLSALMNLALLREAHGEELESTWNEKLRIWAEQSRKHRLNAAAAMVAYGDIRRPDVLAALDHMRSPPNFRRAGSSAAPERGSSALDPTATAGEGPGRDEDDPRLRQVSAKLVEALARSETTGGSAADRVRLKALLDWTEGRREDALRAIREAVRRNRNDYSARLLLAYMANELGDERERNRLFDELRADFADLPSMLWISYARLAMAVGDLNDARKAVNLRLRETPSDLNALDLALYLDVAELRRDEALEKVRRILAMDAGHGFANYVLGSIRLADGDFAAAETAFRMALQRVSTPEIHNDLAYALAGRNRLEDAIESARIAVNLNPDYANGWDTLGEMLRRAGRAKEAETAARKAVALSPENPVFRWNLARTLEADGRADEAAPIWEALRAQRNDLPPIIRQALSERTEGSR